MGSQRPLGFANGLRRTVTPLQLPASCLRGSNFVKLRCLRRRHICPSAAISFSEVFAGSWSDAELVRDAFATALHDAEQLRRPAPLTAASHKHSHPHLPDLRDHHHDQLRTRQQQQHEAPQQQQLAQRLVPTTPLASATQLPARGGVSAGGIALGILLTVALQLVGRWLQRQRWAQQLMELLDLRRSSGSSASTSGKFDGGGGATVRRPGGSLLTAAAASGGSASRTSPGAAGQAGWSASGSDDDAAAATAADGRSAFLGGGGGGGCTGSLSGSSSGTMDGGVGGLGVGQGTAASLAALAGGGGSGAAAGPQGGTSLLFPSGVLPGGPGSDPGESVEWVNMCWRKVWRVYQRGLERWIIDLLQPVFDGLVKDGSVPRWLCRLRVVELTLDHEAPYFSNMRRRNSRKDSDLNGVVDLRYTGGARMLLMLELGEGRWRFKVPVLVSDLDLECQMWLKLRLAPMCPWIGTISLAFVGPPNVKVQLSPYNRVRLMRVPVVQNYLRKLLTVDLPALMVLPERLEINIPPSVTTIAEAAVGRDTIMRAVASAVLQADAVEAALLTALPLGPQTPAGGVTLPEAFKGELSVTLREARNLPVWGFPGQSNPYVRLVLGDQAVQSRREGDTSHPGRHRAPVWNQEFQFLVENADVQVLEMLVKDSHLTGRTEVGRASIRLADLLLAQRSAEGGKVTMWVPLQPPASPYGITGGEPLPTGDVLIELSYKAFDDDEADSGYREAENFSKQVSAQAPITDIRSAAAASSRAAVAASAAVSAIAMTRAAAARAAARAARAAQEAAAAAAGAAKGAVDQGASIIAQQQQQQQQPIVALPPAQRKQLPTNAASLSTAAASMAAASGTSIAATIEREPSSPVSGQLSAAQQGAADSVTLHSLNGAAAVYAVRSDAGGGGGSGGESNVRADTMHVVAAAGPIVLPDFEWRDMAAERHRDGVANRILVPEETRARALATPLTAAALATAAPVAQSARTATAALDRPRSLGPHAFGREGGGDGGSSSNVRPDSRHPYDSVDGGGGAQPAGSHWRRRGFGGRGADASPSSRVSSYGDGDIVDGDGVSSDIVDGDGVSSDGGGADGGGASLTTVAAASVAVQVLEHQVSDEPNGAALRHTRSLSSQPLQPYLEDATPDDVTAEVVAAQLSVRLSLDGAATKVQGQAADGAGSGDTDGGAGGTGSAGQVLSALASLTASAQSLTAAAVEKAFGSLTQKPPPSPQQQQQQQKQEAEEGASPGISRSGSAGDGGDWLAAIVSRLPRYGGSGSGMLLAQQQQHPHEVGDWEETAEAAADTAAGHVSASGSGDDHPWWQFWVPKGGVAKLQDAAAAAASSGISGTEGDVNAALIADASKSGTAAEPSSDGKSASRSSSTPWWQFWSEGGKERDREGEDEDEDEGARQRRRQGADAELRNKPVEAIYIPPDLPLEEIAAEVQRLKEDSWRERSDHVSSLWMKAVERNDRKWLMLAAFLLSVAVGLLTVVAWRLEQLEHMQAAAPQIALMTMQAALQVLEQHASGGGGGAGGVL